MRNAVLEGSRRGAAQAALKAGVSLSRGYLTSFCKANTVTMRLSLHKYSQEGKREELMVLRASAGTE